MPEDMHLFESCFNYIIANNVKEAYYQFTDSYYKNPESIALLHGIIICYVLKGNIEECIHFLEKERAVSPLETKIAMVSGFIKKNENFKDLGKISVIYNLGLFLKRRGLPAESKAYFRTCQTLEPNNKKALAALGECEIRDGNIQRGMRLFAHAAGK